MTHLQVDIRTKIKKAYCPPQVVEANPCLQYIRYLVLPKLGKLVVSRKPENGGDKCGAPRPRCSPRRREYVAYEELEADYVSGALHPGDLKPALSNAIIEMLRPVREVGWIGHGRM